MGWREDAEKAIDDLLMGPLNMDPDIGDAADVLRVVLDLPPRTRIALARELLEGTQPPGEWGALLDEAQRYVRDKPQWRRWIDGTPMDNDVPVWMADFALMVLRRFACRAAMLEAG